jgi:hypothetical protein
LAANDGSLNHGLIGQDSRVHQGYLSALLVQLSDIQIRVIGVSAPASA